MEPLKPETREAVLRNRPQASPSDIDEYERLLAERFMVDPDMARSPQAVAEEKAREKRLGELHRKLFGH